MHAQTLSQKTGGVSIAHCVGSLLLKPAPQTPFTALLLNQIALDAGLPEGAWNTMPCSNEVAAQMVTDDRLKMLSFTGSAAVGWQLKQRAGKKRVTLELGGNAGVIIHKDADLDYAAERCVVGGFSYAGQSCISVQRIFVHRDVEHAFLEKLVPRVRALKCGDPLDEATKMGPMIREQDAARVEAWVHEAVSHGATLVTGGTRRGTLHAPTILANVDPQQRVSCDELFGPAVAVTPFNSFDEALALANGTNYGLSAAIFTRGMRGNSLLRLSA